MKNIFYDFEAFLFHLEWHQEFLECHFLEIRTLYQIFFYINKCINYIPIEIVSVGLIKDEKYVNDLDPYGWGLGFRTLIDPTKNNNLGSKGEFGWAGAAATYFLVDSKKEISAVLMTQALNGDPSLKNNFYEFIYTHF